MIIQNIHDCSPEVTDIYKPIVRSLISNTYIPSHIALSYHPVSIRWHHTAWIITNKKSCRCYSKSFNESFLQTRRPWFSRKIIPDSTCKKVEIMRVVMGLWQLHHETLVVTRYLDHTLLHDCWIISIELISPCKCISDVNFSFISCRTCIRQTWINMWRRKI